MIITAHVKPNASSNRVEWLDEDTVKVWVTAVPEKGKANKAVVELLSKEMRVAKSRIELIRGGTARMKQFEVQK
ncbi:DUF167 domain-containing protein [Candidatus Uhrbacteria bacterium]|jgi:uncharacterized protein|nr:DUF167 domain-containing protein [Candidatus Uhrbacteria bacterium]